MGVARLYELIFLAGYTIAAATSAAVVAAIFFLSPRRFRSGWIVALGSVAAFFVSRAVLAFAAQRLILLSYAGFTNGIMLTIPTFVALDALALRWLGERRLRWRIAAAIGVLVLGYGLARLQAPADEGRQGLSEGFTGIMLIRQIEKDPSTRLAWQAWHRDFPEEIDAMLRRAAEPAGRAPESETDLGDAFVRFRHEVMRMPARYDADAAHAPDAALNRLAATQLQAYSDLQAQPEDCAAMMGGHALSPEYAAQPASPQLDMAVARLLSAGLDAASAGQRTPVSRDVSEPVALEQAIRARMDIPAELRARIGSPDRVARLSAIEQCTLGIAYLRAMMTMPAPDVARLMAIRYTRASLAGS